MTGIPREKYLAHYGILRRSGRYPYGSGGNPEGGQLYPWASGATQSERNRTFLDTVQAMHKQGMSPTEIARYHGITTTQLRNVKSIARHEETQADIIMAQRLRDAGNSHQAIADRMSVRGRKIGESQVRSLLAEGRLDKLKVIDSTADVLRKAVEKHGIIDVGSGVEYNLNVSSTKVKNAVAKLQEEGYEVHRIKVPQLGTNHQTTMKVLVPGGLGYKEVLARTDKVNQPVDFTSTDGGRTYVKKEPPISVNPNRIAVKYGDEGGKYADGVIYVRPGVHDLSLGDSRYAQVRILVDGTHYLKGMAMYHPDLPHGVDLMFNTNKAKTGNKLDAMKPIKDDPDNPFGSVVRQIPKVDAHGKDIPGTNRSALNVVNEEGKWDDWSRSLSSQFLSKQPTELARTQLGKAYEHSREELDIIKGLTNPAVKKRLLEAYADSADAAAVHLKAAALPRQRTQVILPLSTIKPHEIYAPNFENGDRVVLIRHPHGGIFEIPELVVNNNHPEGKKLLGQAKDAVGIHHTVAEKMSGADFDGDTVLVIPNNAGKIKHDRVLEQLKGFDPQRLYKGYPGMHRMTPRETGLEMGKISNLITDMHVRGATTDEISRAVRHSMVVIDAEKHTLNYKQSEKDFGIAALKKAYQKQPHGGASTVLSNAGSNSKVEVYERKQSYKINPVTGEKIYAETGASYIQKGDKVDANGKVIRKDGTEVFKKEKVAKLSVVDAHSVSSGKPIEVVYADHSNAMKALGNEARLAMLGVKIPPYSKAAAQVYAPQVKSLTASLHRALENSPRERRAQIVGNAEVKAKRAANPDMDEAEYKKLKIIALDKARDRVGAKKVPIEISDHEWAAIQAGAITNEKLNKIMDNTNLEALKARAMPRESSSFTPAMHARAAAMEKNGATQAEIAAALGVSVSSLKRELKPKKEGE